MAFIDRENGVIVGSYALQQHEGQEEIADDAAELLAFLNPQPSPLDQITQAVKDLPVEKRTDAQWGLFVSQCLLAIQHTDSEALAYLVNGYETQDADYLAILAAARQLFGIGGV